MKRGGVGRGVATAVVLGAVACTPNTHTVTHLASPSPSDRVQTKNLSDYRWSELPPAPIAGRISAATVWSGAQMLVWAGSDGDDRAPRVLDDGAAYDPATNEWTKIPPSPLKARAFAAAVWTGSAMFVWGGATDLAGTGATSDDGALYDPATRRWRMLPRSPLSSRLDMTAYWTGTEVVIFGGHHWPLTATYRQDFDGAAYNPQTNRWRTLAPIPPPRQGMYFESTAVPIAHGNVFLWRLWDRVVTNGNEQTGYQGAEVLNYDLSANRWSFDDLVAKDSPVIRAALFTGTQIVTSATSPCAGPHSCPYIADLHGWSLDLHSRKWVALPHGPVDDSMPTTIWTGAVVLSFNAPQAQAWDPATNIVSVLPGPKYVGDQLSTIWTGTQLIEWGSMRLAHPPGNDPAHRYTAGVIFS